MNKAELYALDVSIINFLITFLGNTYTFGEMFCKQPFILQYSKVAQILQSSIQTIFFPMYRVSLALLF